MAESRSLIVLVFLARGGMEPVFSLLGIPTAGYANAGPGTESASPARRVWDAA